uniref:Alternative protein LY75 n=1 Tax=Homo sapiens TaxID=9606 RepID=L8E7D1_HUMAN|nr:alternative protein LY75 [Homo sapiens]
MDMAQQSQMHLMSGRKEAQRKAFVTSLIMRSIPEMGTLMGDLVNFHS